MGNKTLEKLFDVRLGDTFYDNIDHSEYTVIGIRPNDYLFALEKRSATDDDKIMFIEYSTLRTLFSRELPKHNSVKKRFATGDDLYDILNHNKFTITDIYVSEEHGTIIEVSNDAMNRPMAYTADVVSQMFTKDEDYKNATLHGIQYGDIFYRIKDNGVFKVIDVDLKHELYILRRIDGDESFVGSYGYCEIVRDFSKNPIDVGNQSCQHNGTPLSKFPILWDNK